MTRRRATLGVVLCLQSHIIPTASSFQNLGRSVRPPSFFALSRCWEEPSSCTKHRRRDLSAAAAKPKRGSVVDSYQTVSVNCSRCGTRLFRYKKKNGTKSNLVKCFVERIAEDTAGVLREQQGTEEATEYQCPSCGQRFARAAVIRGRPALKLVGGKVRMTKK
jgi:predicted RNA-binding Zn-ribbon protein involved in translation (DUF1610 family)